MLLEPEFGVSFDARLIPAMLLLMPLAFRSEMDGTAVEGVGSGAKRSLLGVLSVSAGESSYTVVIGGESAGVAAAGVPAGIATVMIGSSTTSCCGTPACASRAVGSPEFVREKADSVTVGR